MKSTNRPDSAALTLGENALSRSARVVLHIVPLVTAVGAAYFHGPYLIDDAYITFRYAENLAGGHGLVFNRGEAVLGTTTPLFAGLLAVCKLAGIATPFAARAIGWLATLGLVAVVQRLAARFVGEWIAAAAALCIAVHPDVAFTANSGMETALSGLAVYATLWLTLRGDYRTAAAVGAAAFLLRPDGVLPLAFALGVSIWRSPRRAWRPIAIAAALALPWLIYAIATYGSFVPHSIAAKRLIHADAPLKILKLNLEQLTVGLEMKLAAGLALIGVGALAYRRSQLMLVPLWMALYLAGLAASGITAAFPWYASPLVPGVILLAACGSKELLRFGFRTGGPRGEILRIGGAAAFLMILGGVGVEGWADFNRAAHEKYFGQRAARYLRIGELLRARCQPGERLLVGEVGAIAYAMPQQYILDSSGINSPNVLQARRADAQQFYKLGLRPGPEGSPAWVLAVVREFSPRYIVTYTPWLHIQPLLRDAWMTQHYRRLLIEGLDRYYVLERIEPMN